MRCILSIKSHIVITLTCVSASLCWSPVALAIKATGLQLEVDLTSTWDVEEKGYTSIRCWYMNPYTMSII